VVTLVRPAEHGYPQRYYFLVNNETLVLILEYGSATWASKGGVQGRTLEIRFPLRSALSLKLTDKPQEWLPL
jgi:hypothetical protein